MKKITCFTANLTSGGAEHQMVILANLLVDRGYDVTIVTYNDLPDHYAPDIRVKRIRLNLKGNGLVKQWKACKFFWRLHTDCIISYRSTPNFIMLLPMILKSGPKIIAGERNTTIVPNEREKVNYRLLYRRAAYIVPNSFTQASYLSSLGKSWGKRVIPIINYTDVEEFTPKPSPDDVDVIKIGVFSRIFPQKNYERFCQMLYVLKQRTDRRFKVYWYGDRHEGEYLVGSQHIRQLISKYDIEDVIEVKQAIKNVAERMADFHVMCLPSLFEGFSNSLSEYICCGKPVLCSDVSDNSTMVHDAENGFLFNPQDVESMCSAFLRFFDLPKEKIVEMGHKSRMIAEELFDKEKFIQSYINLIEE